MKMSVLTTAWFILPDYVKEHLKTLDTKKIFNVGFKKGYEKGYVAGLEKALEKPKVTVNNNKERYDSGGTGL